MSTLTFDVTTATEDTLRQLVSIPMFVDTVNAELSRRALADTFRTEGITTTSGVYYTFAQAVTFARATAWKGYEGAFPAQVTADIAEIRQAIEAETGLSWKNIHGKNEFLDKLATQSK